MKIPFFKTILAASALFMICSCGDDAPSKSNDDSQNQAIVVDQASWLVTIDKKQYTIGVDGKVKDMNGELVGLADLTDLSNVTVYAMVDQSVMTSGINTSSLEIISPTKITSTAWVLSADQVYVIYPATDDAIDPATGKGIGIVTDAEGNKIGYFVYDASQVGKIVDLNNTPIIDNVDMTTLKAYAANTVVPSSSSAAPVQEKSSSSVAQQAKSSSSTTQQTATSSSSAQQAKSSSSAGNGGSTEAYTIKYVSGGKSGSGWATRYWDCCKPHCAWSGKGGKMTKGCDASGNKINDSEATSMCNGGNSGTCLDQIPQVYNDTLAFAFAAVPGSAGGECGKCFDLQFTGKGKYATDNNLAKLKNKHLIVIASNIGYDVEQGQFDIMIPGGGVGIYNGCSRFNWGPQGAQYGGLLSECETETNYTASKYKSCLTSKCEKSFSGDAKAKEGCLFLANWMNAAGNPLHNYKEVECPKQLLDKF